MFSLLLKKLASVVPQPAGRDLGRLAMASTGARRPALQLTDPLPWVQQRCRPQPPTLPAMEKRLAAGRGVQG